MFSNTCKYGIRAVLFLAVHGEKGKKIGIKAISEGLDLPAPFLGKILQQLAKKKILDSTKGPHGGFSLARNADDISLYDIVEVIDGTDVFNECMIGMRVCKTKGASEKDCPFYAKSHKVRNDLKKLFQEQSIGEYAEGVKEFDGELQL